jgi:hypothetical protein
LLKWELFDAECSLTEIAEEILEFLNPLDHEPKPENHPKRAIELYNRLINWKLALPEKLRSENVILPGAMVLQ